ncbi:signal peptidase I, partial [Helicobacter pylori]
MKFLRSVYAFCSSWVGTIVIVLLVIFFIAQAFIIPSRSMVGTLYEGDMLFVKKFSYGIPIPKIPWIELPVMPDFKNNGHLIEGDRP